MPQKKVCVITGARSDYGLLKPVIRALADHPDFELQIIATGMHLSPEFGHTYKDIENDGFGISAKVEMLLSGNKESSVVKSMGLALIGFADALENLAPDLMLVLGDRYETLCAAQAAMILKIPLAHIHGGEATKGLIDEAIRHSLTKMSHLHFTTAEEYQSRVIQMGEQPETVFNVGAPGLDTIRNTKFLSRDEMESRLELKFTDNLFMVTYHPVTLEKRASVEPLNNLFKALDNYPDATIILTYPNADPNSKSMFGAIENFVAQNPERRKAVTSLGSLGYLSLLSIADAVVGNSSSGIIETPFFGIPTIDIGDRQKGRLAAESVIHCSEKTVDILGAIELSRSADFIEKAKAAVNPYGDGYATQKIMSVLEKVDFPINLQKKFHNIQ